VFVGHDSEGPLWIKVIGRDELDARLFAKLWRSVVYKDSGPMPTLTRVQQVEREAYLTLKAQAAGVLVPPVVVSGKASAGAAVLVLRATPGRPLAELDRETLSDEVLERVWETLAGLHRARIVHNQLDGLHVLVEGGDVHLVGFDVAEQTGSRALMARDTAGLLAATTALVGEERSVRAAVAVVDPADLLA